MRLLARGVFTITIIVMMVISNLVSRPLVMYEITINVSTIMLKTSTFMCNLVTHIFTFISVFLFQQKQKISRKILFFFHFLSSPVLVILIITKPIHFIYNI